MTRGVAWCFVGSVVVLALAGCGRSWYEQREAWRREAELACLKSGAVREGPTIEALRPIDGPGVCGADFPLKVSALGSSQILGFADDPRPPGLIPQYRAASRPLGPSPYASPQSPNARQPPPALAISPPLNGDPEPQSPPQASDPRVPLYQGPQPALGPFVPPGRFSSLTPGLVNVAPAATLACPVISALDNWVATGIGPAALKWFGQPVMEIKQISAYSCRTMNGQRGAAISEHAFGNALDIAAFTLADGRKVTVKDGWRGTPSERAFLHDVQASACQQFATVLAPGSNVFHYDHIHVDLARHASGRSICNPPPVPGDVIARSYEPATTGALGKRRLTQGRASVTGSPREHDDGAARGED
jgi:hypothetical protein